MSPSCSSVHAASGFTTQDEKNTYITTLDRVLTYINEAHDDIIFIKDHEKVNCTKTNQLIQCLSTMHPDITWLLTRIYKYKHTVFYNS